MPGSVGRVSSTPTSDPAGQPVRQPRGEARRRAVLEAVLRVVASEGIRGVTHRSVAAEAGTSLRATTYYFSSKEDLLDQALVHYVDERIARVEEAGAALTRNGPLSVARAAELLAAFVADELTAGHARLVAEYELALEATRSATLAANYARFREALIGLLTALAAAAGSAQPELDAHLILAAVRGIELDALTRPGGVDPALVDEQCRRLVEALLPGPDPDDLPC